MSGFGAFGLPGARPKEKPVERASRGFLEGSLPFGAGMPLNSHNQHVDGFTLPP